MAHVGQIYGEGAAVGLMGFRSIEQELLSVRTMGQELL